MSRAPSRLDKRLRLAVLVLFGVPALAGAVLLLLAHRAGAFEGSTGTLVVAVIVGLAVTMGYVGLVAHGLGRSLVQTLHELRHGAELIATVNPEHRLPVGTGDEMESLARDINRLADQLRDARVGLEHAVARATAELSGERTMLAAILEDLDQGVVVVGTDGRVTLANALAQAWLAGGAGLLGRSLYRFVDRGALAAALARLDREHAAPERVELTVHGGARLEARVTIFRRGEGERAGFILALRETVDEREEETGSLPEWSRFVGAGTTAGPKGMQEPLHRPELYDFSFLDPARLALPPGRRDQDFNRVTFVVFDIETTGLDPDRGDRVVSLAGVKVHGGTVMRSKHFDALVDPGRPIPAGSTLLHGITDARVAGMPVLGEVMPAFLRFAEGTVLVGHEVWFDLRFLEAATTRRGMPAIALSHPVLDTRLLSRLVHGDLPEHGLDEVARRLGVTIHGRHSALGDAYATAEVLVRLLGLLRRRGIITLGALLDAAGSLRRPVGGA